MEDLIKNKVNCIYKYWEKKEFKKVAAALKDILLDFLVMENDISYEYCYEEKYTPGFYKFKEILEVFVSNDSIDIFLYVLRYFINSLKSGFFIYKVLNSTRFDYRSKIKFFLNKHNLELLKKENHVVLKLIATEKFNYNSVNLSNIFYGINLNEHLTREEFNDLIEYIYEDSESVSNYRHFLMQNTSFNCIQCVIEYFNINSDLHVNENKRALVGDYLMTNPNKRTFFLDCKEHNHKKVDYELLISLMKSFDYFYSSRIGFDYFTINQLKKKLKSLKLKERNQYYKDYYDFISNHNILYELIYATGFYINVGFLDIFMDDIINLCKDYPRINERLRTRSNIAKKAVEKVHTFALLSI